MTGAGKLRRLASDRPVADETVTTATKATKWREGDPRASDRTVRQRFHARRHGSNLEVALRYPPDVADDLARVDAAVYTDVAVERSTWPVGRGDRRVVEDAIAGAKAWCEARADALRAQRGAR